MLPGIFAGLIVALATNKVITELLPLSLWLALIALLLLALILGRHYEQILDGAEAEQDQTNAGSTIACAGDWPLAARPRWSTIDG